MRNSYIRISQNLCVLINLAFWGYRGLVCPLGDKSWIDAKETSRYWTQEFNVERHPECSYLYTQIRSFPLNFQSQSTLFLLKAVLLSLEWFYPQGTMSGDIFDCRSWVGVLLTSSGGRPEMLLTTPHGTGLHRKESRRECHRCPGWDRMCLCKAGSWIYSYALHWARTKGQMSQDESRGGLCLVITGAWSLKVESSREFVWFPQFKVCPVHHIPPKYSLLRNNWEGRSAFPQNTYSEQIYTF